MGRDKKAGAARNVAAPVACQWRKGNSGRRTHTATHAESASTHHTDRRRIGDSSAPWHALLENDGRQSARIFPMIHRPRDPVVRTLLDISRDSHLPVVDSGEDATRKDVSLHAYFKTRRIEKGRQRFIDTSAIGVTKIHEIQNPD